MKAVTTGGLHASGASRRSSTPGAAALLAAILASIVVAGCARLQPAANHPVPSTTSCRQTVPSSAAIDWWSAATDRDRDALARWCDTVGPALFIQWPSLDHPHVHDSIVIVSWNVHVGAGDVTGLVRALRAGDLTDGVPVKDFVLLLQEAYRRDDAIPARLNSQLPVPSRIATRHGRAPDVANLAREGGLSLFYAPSMRNGLVDTDREDRGNAIASTLPLQEPTLLELPLQHQRRVVAVATVEGRTSAAIPWTLRLADVHLDTALELLHGGPSAARRRQAEALVGGLDATAPKRDHLATIVAGDFNTVMGRREAAVGYLRSVFRDSPAPPAMPTFSGPLGYRATFDYVFAGGRLRSVAVRRLPSRFGSDHYPLLAVVSF